MKKILIATAVSALLTSSALAETENMFYLKAQGGADWFLKAKDQTTGLKMKPKTAGILGLGVGYYVMDNTRVEFAFDVPLNTELKKTGKASDGRTMAVKHKANIYALTVNGYIDMFDTSAFKVFAGAGVGFAQVKDKITGKNSATNVGTNVASKKANNVVYQLTLGTSAEVAPGVNVELSYRFADYGKTKNKVSKTVIGDIASGKTAYKAHNLLFGVRVDI